MSITSSALPPTPAHSPTVINPPVVSTTEDPPKPEPGAVPSVTVLQVPAATGTPTTPPKDNKVSNDDEEPQNPLTKKFTEQEWTALKELRKQIPKVIAEAYSDNPEIKSKPLILWGVRIDSNGTKDPRASVILMKFLRARNLNPDAAAQMLTATIRWRDQFKIDELLKEEFPSDVFGKLGYVYGKDKGGRPVTYNLYGANQDLNAVFGDVERFIRWRVKLMEQSILKLDFNDIDQVVQVHDYEGVSMRNRDANSKNAASEATSIFQNHYPEFLYRKFFINVPTLLSWIFWLFKTLVSAQTFAKMSVVGGGNHAIAKALGEVISVEELPVRYGGEAKGF
jgi:hypothetical protein